MGKDINDLPVRITGLLRGAGLNTEEEILAYLEKQPRKLLKISGIGETAYKLILDWLDNKTLFLCNENYLVRKQQKKLAQKCWENLLLHHLKAHKITKFKEQYRFNKERKWTFDFAFPEQKLAIEIDGGLHIRGGGGHNSRKGYTKDRLKDQAALMQGWTVYRVTPQMVRKGEAINNILILLNRRQNPI